MTDDVKDRAPRSVHIVDAMNGPLIGDGRYRRMLPFAVTATISLVISVPTTSWTRPGVAIAAQVLLAATIVGTLTFPWQRVPRQAQLIPPFLFLVGTLMLTDAIGNGVGSPFITLSVLPLMWLAIYEHRAAVVVGGVLAGAALWLATPHGNPQPSSSGFTSTAVFIVCCVGMGITLHGLVADARRAALTVREHQSALEQSAAVLETLPERVSRYRVSDHVITYCNQAWATQYNVQAEDAIGRCLDDFLSNDELVGLRSQLELLGPDNPILVDPVARATDGPERQWLEWVDRYVPGADGAEILSIGRDVTRRRQAEIDLARSEAEFRDLADKSADVVWRFSLAPTPHFDYISPSAEALLGYPPSYFTEDFSHLLAVLDEEGVAAITRALNGEPMPDHFDFRYRHANGSIVVGETRTATVRGGLQGVSRDVTELRRLQDEMRALALRDELTGVANRRLFVELLEAHLAHHQRNGSPLALAFLDLDGLKNVNDVYGHDAGDAVLRETARRLLKVVRSADTVARIGGDEFVIVYAPNDTHSHNLIARIDRALAEPITVSADNTVLCPASIGVAYTSDIGYDSTALLAAADETMYETKRARRALREVELAQMASRH